MQRTILIIWDPFILNKLQKRDKSELKYDQDKNRQVSYYGSKCNIYEGTLH